MVSVHPPTHHPIKIFAEEKTVHAFPYKSGREGMDTDTIQLGDIKKVHEQANYTNAILNTIAEQLNQLNAKIDSKKKAAKKDMANSSTKPSSSFTESIAKPFVKLDSILTSMLESLPKPKSPNHDLLQRISEQIQAIDNRQVSLALIELPNKRLTAHVLPPLKKKLLLVVVTQKRS